MSDATSARDNPRDRYAEAYRFRDDESEVFFDPEELEGLTSFQGYALLRLDGNDPRSDKCRKLESIVFSQVFDDHRDKMGPEYDAYEENSGFIVVVKVTTGEIAGCIRIMGGETPDDFKAIHDTLGQNADSPVTDEYIANFHDQFNSKKAWEIGTLTVSGNYRGKNLVPFIPIKVSAILYHGLYVASQQSNIDHWVAMLDEKPKQILHKLGIHFEPLCELSPREYVGSAVTYPCYLRPAELNDTIKDASRLKHALLVRGMGLSLLCNMGSLK